ncbi:MAG: hypothetical protein HY906_12265 [Deltaproteobacteria bacterium]|nr:hypothetical protein [Deltaproteobacteria bacterium]
MVVSLLLAAACGGCATAIPTGVSNPTAAAAFQPDDRVACNWKGRGKEYTGRVVEISEGLLYIHYDDGDREHISPFMCRKLFGGAGPAAAPPAPAPAPPVEPAPAPEPPAAAPPAPASAPAGCAKDTDCKGDRVCENGRCVEPRGR